MTDEPDDFDDEGGLEEDGYDLGDVEIDVDGGETSRVLQEDVEEGLFTRGAQVSVRVGGEERMSFAFGDDGTGRSLEADTLFCVYCTIKPLTSVAIARQVEAGTLDLDEPLAEKLPGVTALSDGAVTLRHVMTHTAGLHRPMAIELELVSMDKRAAALDAQPRPGGWAVGRAAAYSEAFAWQLLGRLLEVASGEPLREHLRSALIEPLGLTSTWIGMTDEEFAELSPRLGVSFDLRANRPFPLLMERGKRMATWVNPAYGGYTNARDLSRFYGLLVAQLNGAEHPALPSADTLRTFTTPARPSMFDEVLDRECEYGLGFMVSLSGHAFGRWCSPSSFGHSGNVGSSFAFADPERDLAVAVVYNGVVDHESAFVRRPAIVRAIYEDLDAAEHEAADDVVDDVEAEPTSRRGLFRRRSKR